MKCATLWNTGPPIWNIGAPCVEIWVSKRHAVDRRLSIQRFPVSTFPAPVDRLVQRFQMWRYEELTTAAMRDQRDAGERLQIARVSHLH